MPHRLEPEKTIRGVLDGCADCDICRNLMDESCLLFPDLYRLYDKEKKTGIPIASSDLRDLVEGCTLCGLCPCPNVRADVIRGKTERVYNEGMPLGTRLLADAQCLGYWGSLASWIINLFFKFAPIRCLFKKIVGIHPNRSLPKINRENFFVWARKKKLDRRPEQLPCVTYFAGCTAGYFFPNVARAAVSILKQNRISVHVPRQKCCGMPTLIEGDQLKTIERVRFNLQVLLKSIRSGYDLVYSCPTCGYLMRTLIKEHAYYSKAYQRSVNADTGEILVPDCKAGGEGFIRLKKTIYEKIFHDDGYFSGLDPLDRIALSDNIMDLGEYLAHLYQKKRLNIHFGEIDSRMVYYAPCHQREQKIGNPYETLLGLIPGLTIIPVGSALDCCGMGGSLGYKTNFYDQSIRLGKPLMKKIQAIEPRAIITDCLSCRLQFMQMTPLPVFHPLEIISRAYKAELS